MFFRNPHKIVWGGPRSVDHGDRIPCEMITETERKTVVTIILAFSTGFISFWTFGVLCATHGHSYNSHAAACGLQDIHVLGTVPFWWHVQ